MENEKNIKIGSTKDVRSRIDCLIRTGKQYKNKAKRILVSEPCTNYLQCELELHKAFEKYRKEGEFFEIPIDKVKEQFVKLNLLHNQEEIINKKKAEPNAIAEILKETLKRDDKQRCEICKQQIKYILINYNCEISDKIMNYIEKYLNNMSFEQSMDLIMISQEILEGDLKI